MRVLYVCPFANHGGHSPYAAMQEPGALSRAGHQVALLTFNGVMSGCEATVAHTSVIPPGRFRLLHVLIEQMRTSVVPQWTMRLVEVCATLLKAILMQSSYDVVHLREAEPFPFMPHLLCLPARGCRWMVWLIGSNLTVPESSKKTGSGWLFPLYRAAFQGLVNGRFWIPLYRASLRRNRWRFATEDDVTRTAYEKYLGGAFTGHISVLPLGVNDPGIARPVTREESRRCLRLPGDRMVLLVFGASHLGKDLETVVRALVELPDIVLMYAGATSYSLGMNPRRLFSRYGLERRVRVFDYYIPESEKPAFFNAADACILSYVRAFKTSSSMLNESCRFGLPVISSDASTLGRLVREHRVGLTFETEDPVSLKEAVRRFSRLSHVEVDEFRRNCAAFVQRRSPDAWARGCTGLYEELTT